MENKFYEILKQIWKVSLGSDLPFSSLDDFYDTVASDLVLLPIEGNDSYSPSKLYTTVQDKDKKLISEDTIGKRFEKDEFMHETQAIGTKEDLFSLFDRINYRKAPQIQDSTNVLKSTQIYNSQNIYNSSYIYSSENVLFSYNNTECQYLAACYGDIYSNFTLRTFDSKNVTECFEVGYSAKVKNSYFIHNCFNIKDCLFCSHLASKQYCVANMQYTKEEYEKIKKMVMDNFLEYFEFYKNLKY